MFKPLNTRNASTYFQKLVEILFSFKTFSLSFKYLEVIYVVTEKGKYAFN